MKPRRLPVLLLVASLLTACNRTPPQTSAPVAWDQPDPALLKKIEHLESESARLETRINSANDDTAVVSFEEKTYGIARNQFGVFPVVGRSVEPYLDGFKIRLAIGNLTTATFHGAKIRLSWRGTLPSGFKRDGAPDKTIDALETFRPGTYTVIEAVVSPAKAEEMKSIEVGVGFDSISLR